MAPSRAAGPAAAEVVAEPPPRPRPTRWSSDGWLLMRRGGNAALANGPAPATYGASQAGAVLRYRLAPENRHRPSAYLRGTAALNGSQEREAAAGLSVRPIISLPVTVAAEIRAASLAGGTRLRPAVTAYTELPPIELPSRLRGEVYAQAGYVGGRYATPFVDGQLRIDRKLETIGRGEVRAGVGAWGGAQKGASRLDLGPAAMVGMGLGGMGLSESASARLALDWRFRVAGNAEPSSGPALTLSAGF
jgi:hypothetical protein